MKRSSILVALGAAVGLAALLRQHREAARANAGRLHRLGPDGRAEAEDAGGTVHRSLAGWRPVRPSSRAGRVVTTLWAAPLTALGIAAGLLGGTPPRWDATHGALVVQPVRGPMRWFLRLQSADAATLGQVVVLRDRAASPRLLVHEAQHARQQERLGPLFALAYPLASACWGYRRNPFEVAARTAARISGPAASP